MRTKVGGKALRKKKMSPHIKFQWDFEGFNSTSALFIKLSAEELSEMSDMQYYKLHEISIT